MSTLPKRLLTPEEYLKIERAAEYKSEYYEGEMFAMAGGSPAHNHIGANALREIGNCLRGRECNVYTSDQRVRTIEPHYAYPDASAVCGESEFFDEDTLLNPTVIVEVLSPSTELYDRTTKFGLYQNISSFREYLLLSSDRVRADLFTRNAEGKWVLTTRTKLDEELTIESVGCKLKMADLYENVKFKQQPARTPGKDRNVDAP